MRTSKMNKMWSKLLNLDHSCSLLKRSQPFNTLHIPSTVILAVTSESHVTDFGHSFAANTFLIVEMSMVWSSWLRPRKWLKDKMTTSRGWASSQSLISFSTVCHCVTQGATWLTRITSKLKPFTIRFSHWADAFIYNQKLCITVLYRYTCY